MRKIIPINNSADQLRLSHDKQVKQLEFHRWAHILKSKPLKVNGFECDVTKFDKANSFEFYVANFYSNKGWSHYKIEHIQNKEHNKI